MSRPKPAAPVAFVLPDLAVTPYPVPGPVLATLVREGDPIAWGRVRIEARGTKLRALVNPPSTTAGEADWRYRFSGYTSRSALVWPRPEPLGVRLLFGLSHARRLDVDNLTKLVLDAGNGYLWADDSQVVELYVRVYRRVVTPFTALLVYAPERPP